MKQDHQARTSRLVHHKLLEDLVVNRVYQAYYILSNSFTKSDKIFPDIWCLCGLHEAVGAVLQMDIAIPANIQGSIALGSCSLLVYAFFIYQGLITPKILLIYIWWLPLGAV